MEGRKEGEERRRVSECTCSAVPPFLTHPGSHSCVWPTKRYATETTRREGAAFSLTRVGNKSIKKGEILRKQCSGSTATEREEEAYSTPQQSSTLRAPSAVQTFPLFLFILSTSHVRQSVRPLAVCAPFYGMAAKMDTEPHRTTREHHEYDACMQPLWGSPASVRAHLILNFLFLMVMI